MNKKAVYLTIDDSPSSSFKDHVALLKKKEIPAVFFCIGKLMKNHWADLKMAIQNGFIIANHSYSHPSFSDLDLESAKNEIKKTDDLIQELYEEVGVELTRKYFRFPYGDKGDGKYGLQFMSFKEARDLKGGLAKRMTRKLLMISPMNRHLEEDKRLQFELNARAIQKYLYELGYTSADGLGIDYDFFRTLSYDRDWSWTFDLKDWQYKGQDDQAFLDLIRKRLGEQSPPDPRGITQPPIDLKDIDKREIILTHDRPETNHFFPDLIELLIKADYRFLQFPN